MSAVCESPEQQFISECRTDGVLDQSGHRARAHQRVEASRRQMVFEFVGEDDLDLPFVKLFFQLHQELVDDTQDDFVIERLEGNGGIEPVAAIGVPNASAIPPMVCVDSRRLNPRSSIQEQANHVVGEAAAQFGGA